jgi:hypothetical protein
MKWWLVAGCLCAAGCQAVSGLDQLRVLAGDGGTSHMTSDIQSLRDAGCSAEDECKVGSACLTDPSLGCLRSCEFASEAPCGSGMRCAHIEELNGDYCYAPSATCSTDGRCDEPAWGTRRCEAGSDAMDCACNPRVAGSSCDLIDQCGCKPGTHCALLAVRASRPSVGCTLNVEPVREPGAACNAEIECPAGYSCWRGLCEKYCSADSECGAGRCVALRDTEEISSVRVCTMACEFDSETRCKTGTRCGRAPSGETYCLVPRSPCPFQKDGVCDEPEGSRVCADGTDPEDCS